MSDLLFRSQRRPRAATKRQAANDNHTLLQQLEASLALELAKARRTFPFRSPAKATFFMVLATAAGEARDESYNPNRRLQPAADSYF
jgi:hypothetical protein